MTTDALKARRGVALTVLSALIFGLYPSATRAAYADGVNLVLMVLATTWIRTIFLCGLAFINKQRLFASPADRKLALWGGIFQTISIFGIIGGLQFLPGPLVIIILFSHTLMLLSLTVWRGEAKLTFAALFSSIAALAGLVLVLDLGGGVTDVRVTGIAFAFVAAVATAIRLYIFGKQTKTRDPMAVGAETFLVTSVLVLCVLFMGAPQFGHSVAALGWTFLSGLSLALGTIGTFYAIAMIGAFRFSLFLKLEPVFGTVFSALLIQEYLKLSQYAGIAIVLGSLVFYQYCTQRKTGAQRGIEQDRISR